MKKYILAFCFLLISSIVNAAPDTTSVSWTGTSVVGTTLTLNGTNYGSTLPTIVIMDNFETGTVGNGMSNGTAGSYAGNWSTPTATGNGPVYSTTESESGSKSMAIDMSVGANGGEFYNQIFLSSTTKFLICFDWKLTGDWPGYGGSGSNQKFAWAMRGNTTTNTDFYVGYGVSSLSIPTTVSFLSNDSPTRWSTTVRNFTINLTTTTAPAGSATGWKQYCQGVDGLGTGDMFVWDRSSTGTFRVAYSTTGVSPTYLADPETQSGFWDRIHLPGYGRQGNPTFWYFDNVYVATGTAAFAHVWLHNQPRMTDSTERTILKPITWSDGTITAMITTNAITTPGPAYVSVCDENFVCDDTGSLVTLGSFTGASTGATGITIKGVTLR